MTTLVTGELLRRPLSSRAWTRHRRVGGAIIMGIVLLTLFPLPLLAEESSEPKSTRMTCGSCPDGYAMTGTTSDAKICKDGDPTLVQCVPLGANILSVCGSCPDGYRQVGNSSNPARCGSADGGHMTQCQLEKMQSNMPDPGPRGRVLSSKLRVNHSSGTGRSSSPPKFRPTPEKKSE